MNNKAGASAPYRAFPDAIDQFKTAIFDVEDSLNSMLDKVPTEISISSGSDNLENGETLEWSNQLIFHRVGKSWRLDFYTWFDHMEPGDETIIRLVDAPLKIRVLATQKLPELLDSIREQRNKKIEEVNQAAEAARAFAIRVMEEEVTRG